MVPESGTLLCPRNAQFVKDLVTLLAKHEDDGHRLQKRDSSLNTMQCQYDGIPDDSADVVGSKATVLKAAVSVIPPQSSAVKWWNVP
ncbi:hypothetical protein TNCV_4350031 [Trichonephila clavipes]|nr:hypothetical protein TNCV_4350031 [Trichonephila clavipes]